jgi:exonuclease III
MRIVTWNCNGALRKKFEHLNQFDADILVIQECEDPALATLKSYPTWAVNHLWVGPTKNKGIGVFAKPEHTLKPVTIDHKPLELFLPCLVGPDEWPLLATWTREANSPTFRYIGQLWKFLVGHKGFLADEAAMLVGDLNSNARWDVWDRWWNHGDCVRELEALGLTSAYHRHLGEAQGQETRPTFFLHRNREKAYHIDYAFAGPRWRVKHVEVGEVDHWLAISDHLPVVVDFE